MIRYALLFLSWLFFLTGLIPCANAQMTASYSGIPEVTGPYSASKVAARMVDGLGFRYYWATEGLRDEDLDFKPSDEARTTRQTMEHIFGLTTVILNAVSQQENTGNGDQPTTYQELRTRTLENIRKTGDILRNSDDGDLENYQVIFRNADGAVTYPFWNLVNGPIEDAVWHTGQIASFRRASGNPINPNASFFTGTLKE